MPPITRVYTDDEENLQSCTVSSTCVDFSIADDKKFLQEITKYDSYLVDCSSILTFIKIYADFNKICQDWTELYDRFVTILNNLEFYDFLAPEIILKLQKIKEPLEKYRSDGFPEPKMETFPHYINIGTLEVALAPDPNLIYLSKEQFDLVKQLENKRNTGEISEKTFSKIIKRFAGDCPEIRKRKRISL